MTLSQPVAKPSRMIVCIRMITLVVLLLSNMMPVSAAPRVMSSPPTPSSGGVSNMGNTRQTPAVASNTIEATKTDTLLVDRDGDGRADPGDTLRYTVAVTNTGSTDATGVKITDSIDSNTTLVPGSERISPLAFDDSYNALRNTRLDVAAPGLLANDTGTAAVVAASGPTTAGGTVTRNADGSFSYTPPTGYTGPDTFNYTVTNAGGTDAATVMLAVRAAPSATADTYQITKNTARTIPAPGVLANDTGFPAPTVTPFSGATAQNGAVTLNADGSFSYTPPAGYTGSDSFTYTITNAVGTANGTVTLTVGNQPGATNDSYTILLNTTLTKGNTDGLLTNDAPGSPAATLTSFGGGSLGGSVTSNLAGSTASFGTGGALRVNADGSFSFTPATDFIGNFTFQYRVTNTFGSSDGTVTIAVQQGPTAVADPNYAAQTGEQLSVAASANDLLQNDDRGFPQATITQFGGGSLGGAVTDHTANTTVAFGTSGSLTVNADGSFTFTSDSGFTGNFTFQYQLGNSVATSVATVTIFVRQGPAASDDSYTTLINTPLNNDVASGLLANDTGVPAPAVMRFGGGSLGGTVADHAADTSVAFGTNGALRVNADGSFSFTPATGVTGDFSFQYRIANTSGASVATVTIVVQQGPTATDDPGYAVTSGQSLNVATASGLLANDTLGYPQATLTSFGGGSLGGGVTDHAADTSVTVGRNGTLRVNADGSFGFTPATGVTGTFTFQYRLSNAVGTADATVTITVRQVPIAVNDGAYSINSNVKLIIPPGTGLLINDNLGYPQATITSFGGGSLGGAATDHTAGGTVLLADGSLKVNADGSFEFTSDTGFTGTFTFQYRLENAAGASDATVTIDVRQPPTAINDGAYTVDTGSSLAVTTADSNDLLDNDQRGAPQATIASFGLMDAGSIAAGGTVPLAGGTLTVNADGSFSLSAPSQAGVYTFKYRLSNVGGTPSAGGTSDATVTIQVRQLPVAVDDTVANTSAPGDVYHTAFNTTLTVNDGANDLLANDTLGFPAATLTRFGAIVLSQEDGTFAPPIGTVASNAAGDTATFGTNGSLTVNADGSFSFTPPTNYTGLLQFQYRIQNGSGSDDGTVTLAVGWRPVAVNDSYASTLIGNVKIDTATSGTPFSVLTNDSGDQVTVALATANKGDVTVNSNGTFTFNPTPGYEGVGGFTYTLKNGFGSVTGTLNLNISGMIWFVDNSQPANGDGRLGSPFNSLANFNAGAAADPGDNIFLYSTGTSYTGGITLLNSQRLLGQGATATLSTMTGLTPPGHSPAFPPTAGANPVLSNSGGTIITLAQNNTLRGFSTDTGVTDISGTNFGTLTVRDVTVLGAGRALALTTGTLDATFTDITSTSSSAEGMKLVGVGGTLISSSGSITGGVASAAVVVSGGNATISYGGTITQNNNQRVVDISGTTSGGGVALNGTINGTGNSGVVLANNAGSVALGAVSLANTSAPAANLTGNTGTISFSALNITNTASNQRGLWATENSGTILSSGGTISTGSGVPVEIARTSSTTPLNMLLTSVTASGSTYGLRLGNTSGSITINGGTISNTSSQAVYISGRSAAVTLTDVSITESNGRTAVETADVAGGSLTLNGTSAVNVSGTGAGNDGIVIDGDGTNPYTASIASVTLNTNSMRHGIKFRDLPAASNITIAGGSITAQGNGRRVVFFETATNGTFNLGSVTLNGNSSDGLSLGSSQLGSYQFGTLNVDNPNGGLGVSITGNSAAVTFRAINQNGGATGVSLTNMTGSFTVTGNATAGAGSGGRIQNLSGADNTVGGIGVYMSNAKNVSLNYMRLNNFSNFAIRGMSVNGFTLTNSTVDAPGGTNGSGYTAGALADEMESSVSFKNLTGTAVIDTATIRDGYYHNVVVIDDGTSALNLTVKNSTIRDNKLDTNPADGCDALGQNGLMVETYNSASATLNVTNNTFAAHGYLHFNAQAADASTLNVTFNNNTLTGGSPCSLGENVQIASGGAGSNTNVIATVSGNTITGAYGMAIIMFKGAGTSASPAQGSMRATITNNTIGNASANSGSYAGSGISVTHNGAGSYAALIENNTIKQYNNYGIEVKAGIGDGVANNPMNVTVRNNTVSNPGTIDPGFPINGFQFNGGTNTGASYKICLDVKSNTITGSGNTTSGNVDYRVRQRYNTTVYLPGYTGANNDNSAVQSYISGRNTGASVVSAANSVSSGGGGFTNTLPAGSNCAQPLEALGGQGPGVTGSPLTEVQLRVLTTTAIDRWAASVSPADLGRLRTMNVQLADLQPGRLAQTIGATVEVDRSAAGWGWFVDQPGAAPAPFAATGGASEQRAMAGSAASGRMDLLSALQHELGHSLGYADVQTTVEPNSLMTESLPVGVRRAPQGTKPNVAAQAAPVTADIGTLPAGKRVVLTFDVVIADPLPQGVTTVVNQASISGSGFTTVLSDDPALPGTADPTVTNIEVLRPVYLPLVWGKPALPDLVVTSLTLTPNKTNFAPGEPVQITAVIKNQGNAPAQPFWVDLYINPSRSPALNVLWSQTCSLQPCYGMAWSVNRSLAPGETVMLTSTPASYAAKYSIWPGSFVAGTREIVVLADSWNPGSAGGSSGDTNTANNLLRITGLSVTGQNGTTANSMQPDALPTRPTLRK